MTTAAPASFGDAHVEYVLRIADGALILAQRLSEWCGHGPVLEEDIAFTNIALDLLGQARLLYTHAGALEGRGRDEDAFAYGRDEQAFLNPTLCELPNGDFGRSVLRTWAYVEAQRCLWPGLTESRDTALAAIAAKSAKETAYHCDHLGRWVVRLGDGTADSHARMQRALDEIWHYTPELFQRDAVEAFALAQGLGPDIAQAEATWQARTGAVLAEATLAVPPPVPFKSGGRQGRHSEYLGYILIEMQSLARAHPGARW